MGCLIELIYVLAASALWRLWRSEQSLLWWSVLGAAVLMFWTAATVRTSYRMEIAAREPRDEVEALIADDEAKRSDVVRFWVYAHMVLTGLTLVLSVLGWVMPAGR